MCGEESVLTEWRGGDSEEQRNKPQFPGQIGLWQKPTVINNVETFINVPQILARGIDWFVAQGAGGSRGLKFVGVSGHVAPTHFLGAPVAAPTRCDFYSRPGGVRRASQLQLAS